MSEGFLTWLNGSVLDISNELIPSWVRDNYREQDPERLAKLLNDAGANCVECYGEHYAQLMIWRLGNQFYIEYHDGDSIVARFIILSFAIMMEFQAQWVAPMAMKIMADDQYDEWRTLHRARIS